jgi:hypothetical protein
MDDHNENSRQKSLASLLSRSAPPPPGRSSKWSKALASLFRVDYGQLDEPRRRFRKKFRETVEANQASPADYLRFCIHFWEFEDYTFANAAIGYCLSGIGEPSDEPDEMRLYTLAWYWQGRLMLRTGDVEEGMRIIDECRTLLPELPVPPETQRVGP